MKEWETKRPNIAIIGCGKSRKSTLSQVIKMIERLEEFEAIGTVEEFKAIKQWKSDIIESFSKYDVNSVDELMKRFKELTENERKCEDCAGCTNWKCDFANIRNKAIDEFAERMKQGDVIDYMGSYVSYEAIARFIDKIALQMKGEQI